MGKLDVKEEVGLGCGEGVVSGLTGGDERDGKRQAE